MYKMFVNRLVLRGLSRLIDALYNMYSCMFNVYYVARSIDYPSVLSVIF